ncbi:hypothetical protein [Frigoribacterium sp. UYMn621]|jgi:hypothetical protein
MTPVESPHFTPDPTALAIRIIGNGAIGHLAWRPTNQTKGNSP